MYDGLQNTELNLQETRNAGAGPSPARMMVFKTLSLTPKEPEMQGAGPSPARTMVFNTLSLIPKKPQMRGQVLHQPGSLP